MTKQVCFLYNTPIFITKLHNSGFYSAACTRIFSRFDFSIFHSRVTFIFANLAAQQIYCWIKKTVERVHYYKFDWQHQQDRRKLGETYLFHPRWRIFVYKSNVGSSAITRPVLYASRGFGRSHNAIFHKKISIYKKES